MYITSYFLNNLVFIYIRMLKNSSAKYYQKTKRCLKKSSEYVLTSFWRKQAKKQYGQKQYNNLSEEGKKAN